MEDSPYPALIGIGLASRKRLDVARDEDWSNAGSRAIAALRWLPEVHVKRES